MKNVISDHLSSRIRIFSAAADKGGKLGPVTRKFVICQGTGYEKWEISAHLPRVRSHDKLAPLGNNISQNRKKKWCTLGTKLDVVTNHLNICFGIIGSS